MTKQTHRIERLILPVGDSDLRALAQLLIDAVESGAAVSFLAPLTLERAEDWWRRAIWFWNIRQLRYRVAPHAPNLVYSCLSHMLNTPHRADVNSTDTNTDSVATSRAVWWAT